MVWVILFQPSLVNYSRIADEECCDHSIDFIEVPVRDGTGHGGHTGGKIH